MANSNVTRHWNAKPHGTYIFSQTIKSDADENTIGLYIIN